MTFRCLDALKKYLNEEHKAKKGSPLDMSEWHTSLKKVNILLDLVCVLLFFLPKFVSH